MDTETLAPTTPAKPAAPAPEVAPRRRRRHGAGHVIAIVVGFLMLLPGLGMLVGGVAAASAQAFATDDGYFRFTIDRIDSDGVAIAASDLWLDGHPRDDGPDWLLDNLDVDLRLRVDGATPTDDVFVGIARTADLERYLAGAAYADVAEMDGHTAQLIAVPGADSIEPPDTQDFWAASVSGDGEQELTWDARGGRWAAVIMNPDGTSGVAADVEVGVRSGLVMPVAIVLMVLGGLTLIGGVALIVVGSRGRKEPPTATVVGTAPAWAPAPLLPPTGTRTAHQDDDHTADDHTADDHTADGLPAPGIPSRVPPP